jgi:uncharacterized cupin superfamily protein
MAAAIDDSPAMTAAITSSTRRSVARHEIHGRMTDRRHPHVVNKDEVDLQDRSQGKFHVRGRRFGPSAGNVQLGGQLLELLPGERAFPMHFHCANEEAVFVVSGTGTARIGEARVPVRAGDWIAHPVGPEHAHQMINDGTEPLVYLVISTQHKCEIIGYPDSKKVVVGAGHRFKTRGCGRSIAWAIRSGTTTTSPMRSDARGAVIGCPRWSFARSPYSTRCSRS